MKLKVVVLPVSDVDRAKAFYLSAGFREDLDFSSGEAFRVVRFTPPASEVSIVFGKGVTVAIPGSVQGLQLVVRDIDAARTELLRRGIEVGRVFHDIGGVFYHHSPWFQELGPDPDLRDYASFAQFCDADGNGWVLQEVRTRTAGR
jgi:catechol 2,3-dioxygenase-like lactoylglutathione lyase family enzyme